MFALCREGVHLCPKQSWSAIFQSSIYELVEDNDLQYELSILTHARSA